MRWMWIDQIIDFEPGQRMSAVKNVSLAEDHLHDHFAADERFPAQPIMPASLMIEGMAQTAGILVGAVNAFKEKVVLAKITTVRLDTDIVPGSTIRYDATLDRIDEAGAATSGTVLFRKPKEDTWSVVGQVDLMFSHVDHNMAGMAFPEENFVFSENFRTILRSAGLDSLAESNVSG
ncbi:MAG: beta-hydroxyacyl-ACP dehydratase [Planctomycetota bacterium]|nr:beta-hydroxyacyl-ACP dehydratase [Planctomycetota bacterium]